MDDEAIERLAERWADERFELPRFDYAGTPDPRDEGWWFDYVTLSVSVLACLWPPEGEPVWATGLDGVWLDDAPGIFACFTRTVGPGGVDVARFADLDDTAGRALFRGRGTLQLIDARVARLRDVAAAILDRWDGSAANLVAEAGRDGSRIAALLGATVPGYLDRPVSGVGRLPFDKLAHLAAAIMAAGVGWGDAGFGGYADFPVYPDYMLPRVLRHVGVLRYAPDLAARIDGREPIDADSEPELAIRWATVHAGANLRRALADRGNPVPSPALDYRLWSEAVLGPDANSFGEHHRTVTLRY